MTHEALVRFAAGKVGGEVEDGEVLIRATVEIGGGHTCPVNNFYQLTSPELFLKGLEVLIREGAEFLIEPGYVHVAIPDNTVSAPVKEIADLPLKFWTAYAKLEGGKG